MIIDDLASSAVYEPLHPLFKKAFDYLKTLDFHNFEPGKTILVEDELIVMANEATLKSRDKARMEVHRSYIDIHVPVSRSEGFIWKHLSRMETPSGPFNDETDCGHFEDKADVFVEVPPGGFVIFFPEDGHAACVGEGEINKIIFKIRVS